MTAALDAVFVVVFMVVGVWVVGFGFATLLIAHGSRWGRASAFVMGALLGPLGLMAVGYTRRSNGRRSGAPPLGQPEQVDGPGSRIVDAGTALPVPPSSLRPPD
jgi:hypothetical protein